MKQAIKIIGSNPRDLLCLSDSAQRSICNCQLLLTLKLSDNWYIKQASLYSLLVLVRPTDVRGKNPGPL